MKIQKICIIQNIAQLDLIRAFFKDMSRSREFYLHILKRHISGQMHGHVDLLSRVKTVCAKNGISFIKYIMDEKYSSTCRSTMKHSFTMNNGLIDSVRHRLYHRDPQMINMLLVPFWTIRSSQTFILIFLSSQQLFMYMCFLKTFLLYSSIEGRINK